MQFEYHVVDVFTQTPLEGNALAVFPDARGLDASTMLRIARETNLSETTFILPPERAGAAAKVRIFTPYREMNFAGHPTIGTAYVLRERGIVSADVLNFGLEENVGVVPIRIDDGSNPIIWLTTPPITREGTYDRVKCAAALGLSEKDLLPNAPCELYSAGNPNIFVPLIDDAAVDRVSVDSAALHALLRERSGPTCLFAFAPTPQGAYSRMFAPELGIIEDPATGSATGPLAAYMMDHDLVPRADGTRFVSEQGTKMGRRSILHVFVHGERRQQSIEVGGNVSPAMIGTLTLPEPA
ncbi:MAG: PhzF family phenazine biosynthesis protein [Candidatus Eremiobacteraeota bacterium]|nr:PhzF family phenazine biosynthesis protein [Candidatus Eremiobacteraeota bacterium]